MIVYILSDFGIPFYIGKGSSKDRAYSHEKYAVSNNKNDLGYGLTKDYNSRKTRKIRKILRENRCIEYDIINCNSELDAYNLEINLIKKYGRRGIDKNGILTNIHPGGTGGDIYSTLSNARKLEIFEKRRQTLNNLPDEVKEARSKKKSFTSRQMMNDMDDEKKKQRAEKISRTRIRTKTGPSPKKGKPATGGNARGIRTAWNKNIDKNSEEALNHKQRCIEYQQRKGPEEKGRTPYKLISPNGEIVEGKNPRLLIEKYDVSERIIGLIKGKINNYKGWSRI